MAEYIFRLPQITQLTISQQAALNEIKQIALSGGPGTGKSVVSLRRHIRNYQIDKKSLLLTFTTTLAKYLSACCRIENGNAANNVKTSLKGKPANAIGLTEVIIDEAQDLPINYYQSLKQVIPTISYGADDSQILYPDDCSTEKQLKELFPKNEDYLLDKNYRNTQRIMKFAKIVFPNAYIPQSIITGLTNNIGELPILLISNGDKFEVTNEKQDKSIIEIINSFRSDTHNIAILVPFKGDAKVFETVLKDNSIADFSIYYDDTNRFPSGCGDIKNVHITTFKSAKGLEFDTVIIPNFHKRYEICGKGYKIEWNDYYVGVTRARSNLYLISNYNIPQLNAVPPLTDKQIL